MNTSRACMSICSSCIHACMHVHNIMDMHEMYSYIQLLHYFGLGKYFVPTRVQPPVVGVLVPAVGKDKSLYAPLCWFLGQVLDEGEPALESNHGFVNGELAGGVVSLLKILDQGIKKGSNLEQRIVTWLTFLDILTIVIQVQELEKEREAVSLDDLLVNNSYMYLYNGTMASGMLIEISTYV